MRLVSRRIGGSALLAAALVASPVMRGAAQEPAGGAPGSPAAADSARGAARQAMRVERRTGVLPPAPARTAPLGDTARAIQLLERATFGVTRASLEEVLRVGTEAWLDRQLHPERIDDSALEARLAAFPAASLEPAALLRAYPPPGAARRAAARRAAAGAGGTADSAIAGGRRDRRRLEARDAAGFAAPDSARARRARPAGARPGQLVAQVAAAKLVRAVHSERQLEEVMTDFWFNHFNVFVGKGLDRYLVAAYEREAIRPYVFGKLEDMLRATARHPAMLFYLDNWQNSAPDTTDPRIARPRARLRAFAALSPAEQQRLVDEGRLRPEQLERLRRAAEQMGKRTPGLNENYARELMELHTLGVDGGYTQQDVIAVARAFTGWTIRRPGARAGAPRPEIRPARARGGALPSRGRSAAGRREAGGAADGVGFVFRPEMHDKGEKVVLGAPLRSHGEAEGLEVLHRLATSPATARHIARKLAVRFVSDDPPQALVDRLAGVFLKTGGDLREVTRALFTAPELYAPEAYRAKVKTPLELVASALRATGADVGLARGALQTLRTLGQVPYGELAPTGYPAASEEWVNSGAMLNRMNFALALASGRLAGVRVDRARFLPADDADPVPALAAALLPGQDTRALQATVRAELDREPAASPAARATRAAGLILGSPEFQRR